MPFRKGKAESRKRKAENVVNPDVSAVRGALSAFYFASMTKILLLGLGRWGANHVRVLKSLPLELFAADTELTQLDVARKVGVTEDHLAISYKEFVNRVDGVVVVTPAPTHFPLCKEFLEAGKDVFVEKPMTLASGEAKQLAELADRQKRILQVGHILRFDTASQWLRDSIGTGQFGRVQMLRSNFSGFKRLRNDSGIMFADAIHFVDLFNYFLGGSPKKITALAQDFMGRGPQMDDASLLSLEYETPRGIVWGIVETNYFLPGKYRELAVIGSDMSALCDFNVSQYKIRTFANKHVKNGNDFRAEEGMTHQIECSPIEPLLAELQAFVQAIESRQKPDAADGWAGYESVRVVEAAMESVKTGRTVALT
jgi:UDP-2-acetamido-3-amino-2,3-dideoxy-glucuronate N-acetyltransferase